MGDERAVAVATKVTGNVQFLERDMQQEVVWASQTYCSHIKKRAVDPPQGAV